MTWRRKKHSEMTNLQLVRIYKELEDAIDYSLRCIVTQVTHQTGVGEMQDRQDRIVEVLQTRLSKSLYEYIKPGRIEVLQYIYAKDEQQKWMKDEFIPATSYDPQLFAHSFWGTEKQS